MKKMKYLIMVITLLMIFPFNINAEGKTNIYFFYSRTCQFCAQQKTYLESIKKEQNLDIHYYDLSVKKNDDIMIDVLDLYNIDDYAVPFTIIGEKTILGFVKTDIDSAIRNYQGDDPKLLNLTKNAIRLDMDKEMASERTNTTTMLIFFGVIVLGLFFLLKPEKKRG